MATPRADAIPFESSNLLGFPPGTHYLVLPRRPVRAARAGLTLYDAHLLHQKVALAAGTLLLHLRLDTLLRIRSAPPLPAGHWWRSWIRQVAEPIAGPVGCTAFRLAIGHDEAAKVTALLMNAEGQPVAFLKLPAPGRSSTVTSLAIRELSDTPPGSFRVPRLLAEGAHEGVRYLLQEPLPEGRHRRATLSSSTLGRIANELQKRLAVLPREDDQPADLVPIHGDLTPENVRLDSNDQIWLLDWDRVGWGPRLADELVYWLGALGTKRLRLSSRRATKLAGLLKARGGDADIADALSWRASHRAVEGSPAEQALRDGLEEVLSQAGDRSAQH